MITDFVNIHETGHPTLVMLHGTGGDEREMLSFGKSLLPGVGYFSVRGKEPEHGMNRFFRRMAEGVFDEPNLIMRADELADYLVEQLPDTKRVAVGFSNGANMAAAILLRRPEAFDAAVLLAAMVPLSPETLPDLTGKRILMVSGLNDPIVPNSNTQRLAMMFEQSGADIELVQHQGGHGLDEESYLRAKSWLTELARS